MYNLINRPEIGHILGRIIARGRRDASGYADLTRADCTLPHMQFYTLCIVSWLRNHTTRIVDFNRQRRYIRCHRSKAAANRNIGVLARTHMRRVGPHRYYVHRRQRSRPINTQLLWQVTSPAAARYVQYLVWLAYWRQDLRRVTVNAIQRGLRVDRNEAVKYARWLRGAIRDGSVTKCKIRAIVFYSTCPAWWQYPHGSPGRPLSGTARDGGLILSPSSISIVSRVLTSSAPPAGGHPDGAETPELVPPPPQNSGGHTAHNQTGAPTTAQIAPKGQFSQPAHNQTATNGKSRWDCSHAEMESLGSIMRKLIDRATPADHAEPEPSTTRIRTRGVRAALSARRVLDDSELDGMSAVDVLRHYVPGIEAGTGRNSRQVQNARRKNFFSSTKRA